MANNNDIKSLTPFRSYEETQSVFDVIKEEFFSKKEISKVQLNKDKKQ